MLGSWRNSVQVQGSSEVFPRWTARRSLPRFGSFIATVVGEAISAVPSPRDRGVALADDGRRLLWRFGAPLLPRRFSVPGAGATADRR